MRFETSAFAAFTFAVVATLCINFSHAQTTRDIQLVQDNDSIVAIEIFLAENFRELVKLETLRVAVVRNETVDLDLAPWPGELIAERLAQFEASCGVPIKVVSYRDEYHGVVALWDDENYDGRVAEFDRVVSRAADALQRIVGPEDRIYWLPSHIDDLKFLYSKRVLSVLRGRDYEDRLLPLPLTWIMLGRFADVIDKLDSVKDDHEKFESRKAEAVGYFSHIRQIGICTRFIW
jgi:hypothetical protein